MKKAFKYFLSVLILSGVVLYSGCGGNNGGGEEDPQTEQQKAAESLSDGSPWTVSAIDSKPSADVDATELLSLSMTFNITGTGSEIVPSAFSASGAANFVSTQGTSSWDWASSTETNTSTITITDASISQFTNVSFSPNVDDPTAVTMSFTVANTGGRMQGIVGDYTITLSPAN